MGSLAWFIFITFIVIGVQAYIYGKWGLTGITYKRSFSERAVFAGEKIEMVDELVNEKILPLPWVRLESRISYHLEFIDRKSTRLNSSHVASSYAVFCLKKK